MGIGTQRQEDDRESIGLHLCNDGFINALWQALAHTRDLVTHIGGSRIRVTRQGKADRYLASLLSAGRCDDVHTLNTGQRIFQNLGDLSLNHLTGCAAEPGLDRHHRLINLGILAHIEAVE